MSAKDPGKPPPDPPPAPPNPFPPNTAQPPTSPPLTKSDGCAGGRAHPASSRTGGGQISWVGSKAAHNPGFLDCTGRTLDGGLWLEEPGAYVRSWPDDVSVSSSPSPSPASSLSSSSLLSLDVLLLSPLPPPPPPPDLARRGCDRERVSAGVCISRNIDASGRGAIGDILYNDDDGEAYT